MDARQFCQQVNSVFRSYCRSRSGNVATMFAFAVIPMIGFVGAAVDYSVANKTKAAMQAALDQTALMIAKNAGNQSASEIQTLADNYVKAFLNGKNITGLQITTDYSQSNSSVKINASGSVKTNFMGLMGFNTLDVRSSSTAQWGSSTKLRVALVLDNTGSMADNGKMTALQTATKSLLSRLSSASKVNGDVVVSIIPFVKDVNLGSSNSGQPWLLWDDGTDNSWDGSKGTCSKPGNGKRSLCIAQGTCSLSANTTQPTCTSAGTCSISGNTTQSSCTAAYACSVGNWNTQSACNNHGGTWNAGVWTAGKWTAETWTPASHSTWNGCVVDRGDPTGPSSGNYDTNAVAPTTSIPATLYVPESYSDCPQQAMALSYNWSAMTNLVNNMAPAGETNQGIGLQVGWLSLTNNSVLSGPPKTPGSQDHIILLTDGLNTKNRWYSDQASIDAREALLCSNVKAAGITLWTIQVNTGGDPTSTLLQQCATDSDKFFLLTSANQILSAFDSISFKITNLFLSK
jgi:Flp pilus assembly protein TadG